MANYTLQRAQAADVVRGVTVDVASMVLVGALAGLALGMASMRYIESLLSYLVKKNVGIMEEDFTS